MPGVLANDELVVKVDDPTCCRVDAGTPIVVGDATLLDFNQLRMKCHRSDSGLTWARGTPEHQEWRWIWKKANLQGQARWVEIWYVCDFRRH